jgi:hypothetical protein
VSAKLPARLLHLLRPQLRFSRPLRSTSAISPHSRTRISASPTPISHPSQHYVLNSPHFALTTASLPPSHAIPEYMTFSPAGQPLLRRFPVSRGKKGDLALFPAIHVSSTTTTLPR